MIIKGWHNLGVASKEKVKREKRTKSVREVATLKHTCTHTDTVTQSFLARTTLVWCVWSFCRAENCHTPSAYFDFWQHKVVQIHVPGWIMDGVGGRGETTKSSRLWIIWEHVPDTTKRHQFDWFVAKFSLFLIYNQIHWATKLALCACTQRGAKQLTLPKGNEWKSQVTIYY